MKKLESTISEIPSRIAGNLRKPPLEGGSRDKSFSDVNGGRITLPIRKERKSGLRHDRSQSILPVFLKMCTFVYLSLYKLYALPIHQQSQYKSSFSGQQSDFR